jgi:carboxymethylenebutenolidase
MPEHDLDPALDPELDKLSRRRFVKSAGAGAAAAAALGAVPLGQSKTGDALKDPAILTQEITFESGGQKIGAFLARPRGEGKRGAVIVIQEIFGLNEHIKDVTARVALAGFVGLGIDFFSREGAPPDGAGGFQSLMQFVGKIPDSQVMADIAAGAEYLRKQPYCNGKVGTVGFCWGGRMVMLAAAKVPTLNAGVAYYGRIRQPAKTEAQPAGPIDLVEEMKVPLMGHFGAEDSGIPVADVEALRDALKARNRTAEFHIYPGAGHAFNNDTRPSYRAEAAKLAWQRTLEWFAKHLK